MLIKKRNCKSLDLSKNNTNNEKVTASDIASTVAILSFIFYIIRYFLTQKVLNLFGSPIYTIGEEKESAIASVSALTLSVFIFFISVIITNILKNTKINIKMKNLSKRLDRFFASLSVCKRRVIIFIFMAIVAIWLCHGDIFLQKYQSQTGIALLIALFIVIALFIMYHKDEMTTLGLFNLVNIFIALVIIFSVSDINGDDQKQYLLYYKNINDETIKTTINNTNSIYKQDFIIINNKDNPEDNATIYIPKSRILLYKESDNNSLSNSPK